MDVAVLLDFINKEMKCSRDNPVGNSSDLLVAISKRVASSLLLLDTLPSKPEIQFCMFSHLIQKK